MRHDIRCIWCSWSSNCSYRSMSAKRYGVVLLAEVASTALLTEDCDPGSSSNIVEESFATSGENHRT